MFTASLCRALALVLSAASCSQAASNLVIISSESRGWGSWSESGENISTTAGAFDTVSIDAQGVSTNVVSSPRGLSEGTASVSPFQLSLSAYSAPWWEETWGSQLSINSTAVTRFSPLSDSLQLEIRGAAMFNYLENEQELEFTLRDVTGAATLLNLRASSDWFPWFEGAQFSYNFLVDPTHEYEFAISGWIAAWDAKDASLSLTANVVSLDSSVVPEPGSVSFLVLASGALFLRNRRFIK